MTSAQHIEQAVRHAAKERGIALIAYLTAGYPTRKRFLQLLAGVGEAADVVEVGVPFSDPMADGATIQEASRTALQQGASLQWILTALESAPALDAPVVLMSYLNPILRFGFERLAERGERARVSGVIIPDLPFDEGQTIAAPLRERGLAVVQMATPVTTPERLARVAAATSGFLYAVTSTGTTGGGPSPALDTDAIRAYLASLRSACQAPICAGFGIRTRDHVDALRGACDGVIVGSALIEAIGQGDDPAELLRSLR